MTNIALWYWELLIFSLLFNFILSNIFYIIYFNNIFICIKKVAKYNTKIAIKIKNIYQLLEILI